jgi:septum formation protein
LGADTTVVLDGQTLGKPADLVESERMLRALRGREHEVHTGVALVLFPEASARVITVTTRVRFRPFDDATLHAYVQSREGMDKAGSYGIQDLGAALVSEVHGSYGGVVGLPAAETVELLGASGVLEAWP